MSWMKGDLLSKTRKLVGGLATREPLWLKAMEASPPPVFPRSDGKIKKIVLPEDVYVRKFNKKFPESASEEPMKVLGYDPDPARVFASRILELKEHGVSEEEAMNVAGFEYRSERRAKKRAYRRLRDLAKQQGTKIPPNPYPSAIKEIQAPEKKFVRARFFDPDVQRIVYDMKVQREAFFDNQVGGGRRGGSGQRRSING